MHLGKRPRTPILGNKTAILVAAFAIALTLTAVVTSQGEASAPQRHVAAGPGYWLVTSDGVVRAYGGAATYGSLERPTAGTVVGMAAAGGSAGYWLVTSDGAVLAFGGAKSYGSMAGRHLAQPVVGMAATPDGRGYWLVASDGGIFSFGDARYYGSIRVDHLRSPVVGMAATPDGRGYWLVARDGAVFSFGDLAFYGSANSAPLGSPVVGMETTPDGKGYWLVTAAGKVFALGDATSYGSAPSHLKSPIIGMSATLDGGGYWLAARDGEVFNFGDAAAVKPKSVPLASKQLVRAIMASNTDGYAAGAASGVGTTTDAEGSATTTGTSSVATSGSNVVPLPLPGAATLPAATPTVSLPSVSSTTTLGLQTTSTTGAGTTTSTTSQPGTSTSVPALTTTSSTVAPADTTTTTSQLETTTSTASTLTVAGESYQTCSGTTVTGTQWAAGTPAGQYLTSPWTYDSLATGSESYTVVEYEALSGYGTTLPPLPSYIEDEPSSTEAAVIYAPSASGVGAPGYGIPGTPVLFFFEGGQYGPIGFPSVSGDLFIGGSAPGFSEPVFNDGGGADGISDSTSHYGFSGGEDMGSGTAGSETLTVGTGDEAIGAYLTFGDGTNYHVTGISGTTLTVSPALTTTEANTTFWYNNNNSANGGEDQIAEVSSSASRGSTQVAIGDWLHSEISQPVVSGEDLVIGGTNDVGTYLVDAVTGLQSSGYTLTLSTPLSANVGAGTPVWYADQAGGVTVEYLDIGDDVHSTDGTLTAGPYWTIEHNDIHDGYAGGADYAQTSATGIAIAASSYNTIEYNCFQRMGEYALNGGGTGTTFDYNQVDETPYQPDLSGNGQSGCGKWWGTTNSDLVDNAFTDEGYSACIWFDDGNTGMLVEGNYFYDIANRAVQNETGYNSEYIGNLFEDVSGGIYLNDSGGWDIPGSRYNDEVVVQGNTFYNAQQAVDIWGASGRNCLNSGESAPDDDSDPYCSGGYPQMAPDEQYFTHYYDSTVGPLATVASNEVCSSSAPCSTVSLTGGAPAIDDYIGFAGELPDICTSTSPCGSYANDPVETATTDGTDVSTFTGSGTINVASTTGFPTSGQLLVDTSSGSLPDATGAVVSYSGTTQTNFTGVKLVSGSGTLAGTIEAVQPYHVTAISCLGGSCSGNVIVSVSPPITSGLVAGTDVYSTGTCAYYLTTGATPSSPTAPNGTSYYDGCMWENRNISVTGNTFDVDPSQFVSAPAPEGSTAWTCTTGPTGNCAENAMGYQYPGGNAAPYNNVTLSNAMMSDSSLPAPLNNLNDSDSPLVGGATGIAANAEQPYGDLWSGNTYIGDWTFQAYTQAAGCPLSWTGGALEWVNGGGDACAGLSLSQWQQYWGQD